MLKRLQPVNYTLDTIPLIKAGRVISVEHRNGALFIRIPIYVVGESVYGAVYCSSDELPPLAPTEIDGERFTRVDKHWWAQEYWHGK